MQESRASKQTSLEFENIDLARQLFGERNTNLQKIAKSIDVIINARGNTVFLTGDEKFVPVEVYEFGKLDAGNIVRGPAIIEAPTTTMLILPGQAGRVDKYKNLRVTEI